MRRPCKMLGFYVAGAGLLIVLAILLPSELWWLFLGLALILAGVLICRC